MGPMEMVNCCYNHIKCGYKTKAHVLINVGPMAIIKNRHKVNINVEPMRIMKIIGHMIVIKCTIGL